jgi:hypothetical protein
MIENPSRRVFEKSKQLEAFIPLRFPKLFSLAIEILIDISLSAYTPNRRIRRAAAKVRVTSCALCDAIVGNALHLI